MHPTDEDSEKAVIEIIASLGELEIAVPGLETDACKFMKCPLKKGVETTLKYVLTVPSIAPTVSPFKLNSLTRVYYYCLTD